MLAPKDRMTLTLLSDLHVGSRESQHARIQEVIQQIADTPNLYGVLIGDLANMALKESKSDIYQSALNPQEELELLQKWFLPIKHKLLAAVPGNHEMRAWRGAGMDMTSILAQYLGIPHGQTSLILQQKVGDIPYTIFIHHGIPTGGRTTGKFESNHRLAQMVDADCYLSGHIHHGYTMREGHYLPQPDGSLALHEHVFATCTSYTGYEPYAEWSGFPPGIIRPMYLEFSPTTRDITVTF
jgi:predicted phosphodiesterase